MIDDDMKGNINKQESGKETCVCERDLSDIDK